MTTADWIPWMSGRGVTRGGRNCWVARIAVRVRTSARGHPLGINAITVTHSSGAWERKMVRYGEPVPERMLFDLRGLSGVGPALSFGP